MTDLVNARIADVSAALSASNRGRCRAMAYEKQAPVVPRLVGKGVLL